MIRELKIPKQRVAIFIGKKGETKKQVQIRTKTRMVVDKEGLVVIKGESFDTLIAESVVRAIARGFSPEKAMMLVQPGWHLEIIDVKDYGESQASQKRLKGRVIGQEGKAKRMIEEMTECYLSVYGKTVGVIGRTENVINAKIAIGMLLGGAKHSSAYRFLERKNRMRGVR